jgi:hypothetical protein
VSLAQIVVELREASHVWVFSVGFVAGVLFCAWLDKRLRG